MKKQWKRLLTALTISSSVFAVTWYWYEHSGVEHQSDANEKPLAYVGKVVDDIQRRPSSRLLWQIVNTGEPLYNGEAIRTSERGEVRIQFAGSDRYLDLEPESLIVIKQSDGEIALDLMEGSLFVNSKTDNEKSTGPGLVLNSAKGKVDLSRASASLSVDKGKGVEVQILEGKASIKGQDGKTVDLNSKSEVTILSPLPQKPVAMNAELPEPVLFKWQGFPKEAQVSLWVGSNRKNMVEVKKAQLTEAQVLTELPFGKHYWKLIALSKTGEVVAESTVYKTDIIPLYAPTVTFPIVDAEIATSTIPHDLTFKWEKGDDTRQMTLEIWRDPELTQKVLAKSFTKEDTFTVPGLNAGTYFWRLSSYFTNSDKPIIGKVQKFTIQQTKLSLAQHSPVEVKFNMGEADLNQYYIEKPQVDLSWTAQNSERVASWRVKLHEEQDDPAKAKIFQVKDTKIAQAVTRPGRYIASIEAIDSEGNILGKGTSNAVTVAPLPLLKAPEIISADPTIQATMDGRLQLEWNKIVGAKEYLLTIRKGGKEVKKTKYANNSTSLKNLLPGEYEVHVSAVDEHGRPGEKGEFKKILVPDKSNVKAPTLKKIKVN